MASETISIIIPAYNSSGTICETVDAVLNQTRVPDEIIVVDDCGPDDLPAALGERMKHITYIRHETNTGVAGARNTGFLASTGSLVSFHDGDDILFSKFMETASRVLAERPDIQLCFGAFHSAFDDQIPSITDRDIPENPELTIYKAGEILQAYLYDATSPLINFGLTRRSTLEQILKDGCVLDPTNRMTPDFNYMLELFVQFNLAFIEDPCGIWRLRANSLSQDQLAMWESRVHSLTSVLTAISSRPVAKKSIELLEENERASVRYCGKLLALSGKKSAALKVLLKEFFAHPRIKTAALFVLIALGLRYRKQEQKEGDWRGSRIK